MFSVCFCAAIFIDRDMCMSGPSLNTSVLSGASFIVIRVDKRILKKPANSARTFSSPAVVSSGPSYEARWLRRIASCRVQLVFKLQLVLN